MSSVFALLSQPNVGKSTLFNGLTGSRQRVGNWPGKTVEKKNGHFSYNGNKYTVVDLPGSYSLSANSEEEVVARDYIADNDCDLVCIMADASQLERSMFMLADYAGIHKPVMLVLNMIDLAAQQGKNVNVVALEEKLGIPVVAMSAAYTKQYDGFYEALEETSGERKMLNVEQLANIYTDIIGDAYLELVKILEEANNDIYSPVWMAAKLIENDSLAVGMAKEILDQEGLSKMDSVLSKVSNGSLLTGECKFNWIVELLDGVVDDKNQKKTSRLNWFDRLMTARFAGKIVAFLSLFIGLMLSLVVGGPIMSVGFLFPLVSETLHGLMANIGVPAWLISLIADALVASLGYTIAMAGVVLGITFVFGFLESIGFMARVSYAFDNTFSKMGLHGKSIMPMIVSFGCNMGGCYSSRIIDTWGQRTLTVAISWAIPCAGSWGVIALLISIYFGAATMIVIAALFAVIIFHIWLTAKIFRPMLLPNGKQTGLIMELPPYHRPKWGTLFRYVFSRFLSVFWKALKMVSTVTVIVWLLSGMGSGEVIDTPLYRIGKFFEPVTSIFGLNWQLFIAWVTSLMGKEATLGVFSALFTSSNGVFITQSMHAGVVSGLTAAISEAVTRPEALAFIFAFTFNVPCLMTVSATHTEIHSTKWTTGITLYYLASALVYAFLAYRIGMLIW